jgi:hypothetical protein
MAIDVKPAPDASVTELVSGIVSDTQVLVKQQFDLFKAEVREDLRQGRDAGLLMAAGAGLAFVSGVLLMFMLVYLLNWAIPHFPLWASYLTWGAIAGVAGGLLIYAGVHKLASFNPLPKQSAQALKENLTWKTSPK